MKQTLLSSLFIAVSTSLYAQVGIGLTEPKAFLNVAEGKTVLFGADTAGVQSQTPGTSPKVIWYGSKGAFRAGGISNDENNYTHWDNANVGRYSFASGAITKANGDYSTAMGFGTQASGQNSTAFGSWTFASGDYSTAMGSSVRADHRGSFIIGDDSNSLGSTYNTTANNQMMTHFAGGYVLYTSNARQDNFPSGVQLEPNAYAWSVVSDSTRKENFRATDGALFLKKISGMRLGSWNYKGQDVKQYRHYGPMAQDFFAAFGRDELGLIGENKSINQADFDGVNLIAIQALIKEVEALKAENKNLKQAETSMKAETESLKVKMQQFEKQLSTLMASGAISTLSK
ncbi:tail fiber domain-containing protein [Dyadobacter chenwenxiniae]|uniref:Tail fiber domain-containing protein n=1 Tax=Dyadobacter chenwenxiniae TaxID=2906456 RepID=A0A9X1PKW4_9BACT|nr:tail fiber domain-containing protein [Dyadobacter chenwenxiniae]MCF0063212.1 tail fiber domain-containing protein [Dyadobacter chenwenxiniae]UON85408.1 tail fiber domain-containing protein [Dyadobacter chenwenxiniae]